MDDSVIMCDEIIDDGETNFNEKENITCKAQTFYISLALLWIITALLVSPTIYCYLIKYREKQKNIYYHLMTQNLKKSIMII